MSKFLVVANWKMNPGTMREAHKLFEATRKAADTSSGSFVVVAPPSIYLREISRSYRGKKIAFASQDAHHAEGGAHTGRISLQQAKDAGVSYAIVGHSETRASGKSDDDTRKEVAAALALRLTPILCVGELSRDASGDHLAVVREQLTTGLADVPVGKLSKVLIAYEPVWAIGGETTMSPREMHEMSIFIRKVVVDRYSPVGHSMKVLYGGSVSEKNTLPMLEDGDVDGLLVGHVSIDAARFAALLSSIANT